jgi:hypothetical protein
MNTNQSKSLTKLLANRMPMGVKVKDYLVEKLRLSQVTVYRRMRGEIPFSFEEIAEISLDLDFSVDELIMNYNRERGQNVQPIHAANSDACFLDMLEQYNRYFQRIAKMEKVMISMNNIDMFLVTGNELLFKFFYYRWVCQSDTFPAVSPFSQTGYSEEIQKLRQKLADKLWGFKKIDFIIHRDLFRSFAREIGYFYSRKLLTEEEIKTLKRTLYALLYRLFSYMQSEKSEYEHNIYLSLLDVEQNIICATQNRNCVPLFHLYSGKIMTTQKADTEFILQNWFEQKKKYSTLVTMSSELLRGSFIEKQSEYIESMTTPLQFYEM